MTGCVVLFPVDGFFSPIYAQLGIDIFGKWRTLSGHIL
ncbi:uncharacterized protein J3R85_002733 [Psidium guajava]|nr:uncharacterized protein J3R85_002733 [Psidium guajava]